MTEQEWLACTDPQKMLEFLRGKVSDRKLRLFGCACARRLWPLLTEKESREAVKVAEQFADGRADGDELAAAEESAEDTTTAVYGTAKAAETPHFYAAAAAAWAATEDAIKAATFASQAVTDGAHSDAERSVERVALARRLQDIIGNPFRPMAVDLSWLSWNDGTVVKLAQAFYDERAFDRMPVLADALEEAGCHDTDILGHCRSTGKHVRGCWVVDLILGKDQRPDGARMAGLHRPEGGAGVPAG
jgi:hypothetical protein